MASVWNVRHKRVYVMVIGLVCKLIPVLFWYTHLFFCFSNISFPVCLIVCLTLISFTCRYPLLPAVYLVCVFLSSCACLYFGQALQSLPFLLFISPTAFGSLLCSPGPCLFVFWTFACSLLDYTCLNRLPWFWPLPASLFRKLRTFFVCLNKSLRYTSSASVVCIWIQFLVFLVTLLVLEDIPAGVLGLSQENSQSVPVCFSSCFKNSVQENVSFKDINTYCNYNYTQKF